MNYAVLDEALDYLNGYDINARIEATIESGNIIDGIVINEAGEIREFIQKAIEAIKKVILWISTKVEGIVAKAIDKFRALSARTVFEKVKKKVEKNGNSAEFDKLCKKQYRMSFPKNVRFDLKKVSRNNEENRDRVKDVAKYLYVDNDYILVIEDTLDSYLGKQHETSRIIDNYISCKNYLKKQQIEFETERKNLESLLKKADNDFDRYKITNDITDVNEKIETAKAFCTVLLECIKLNFETYNEMISDLKAI